MNTDHLRYFLTVARCGSISRAAEELCFKQQYISNIIRNLEKQLNVTLFERQARGVVLTKDGEYLRDKAETILTLVNEIEQAHHYPSYALHRQAFDTIFLYSVPALTVGSMIETLSQFSQLFPNATVTIVEQTRPEILLSLRHNPTSLGITLLTKEEYTQIPDKNADILFYLNKTIRFQAVTRKDNPALKTMLRINMASLMQNPLVIHAPKGLENSMVQHALRSEKQPNIKYTVESRDVFLSLMRSDHYWSITSTEATLDDALTAIPISDCKTIYSVFAIHKNALSSFPTKSLLDLFVRKTDHMSPIIHPPSAK